MRITIIIAVWVMGSQGYAAFDVNNMFLDLTGYDNVIHHKSNGVVAARSDVTVLNCTFHDIQPDAAYTLVGNGAGINCHGLGGWHLLKQEGFGNGASDPASFTDCRWGIYTQYMSLWSAYNHMDNVGTAYRVEKSGMMDVDIQHNRLDTRRDGIVLVMNDGASHVLVEGNDITFAQNLPPGQYTKGYYGIRVYEANTNNPNSQIINNTIRYRQGASTAFGGIGLVGARRYQVAHNTMLMTDNGSNYVGVLLNGCTEPEVSCNDILGASNGYPLDAQAGIRNFGGTAPLISCNRTDSTTNGLLFSGWTLAEVRGNEISHHKYGFHLEQNAIIGPQAHRGNLWLEPAQVLGAWCETQLTAVQSLISYDPALPNNVPITYSPASFFDPQAGFTFSCYEGIGECVGYKERCEGCANEFYQAIADSTLENGTYTAETRWSMNGDLYEILKADSALLLEPGMQAFYSAVQSTANGALKDMNESRNALFAMDSAVVAELQNSYEQLVEIQSDMQAVLEQLASEDLSEGERISLKAMLHGLRQSAQPLVEYKASTLNLAMNSRVQNAEGVKNDYAMIGATELAESNSKSVNEIFLSTIAKANDEFSAQQAQDLFTVANQCPLIGGNAVFTARAIYYLLDSEQDFDDPALCLQHGLVTKSQEAMDAMRVSMVPNPADNSATLLLSAPLNEAGILLIYDALGAEVSRVRVLAEQQRVLVNTGTLATGLYHFTVSAGATFIGMGKVSIAR
jgi:hypothetical protein